MNQVFINEQGEYKTTGFSELLNVFMPDCKPMIYRRWKTLNDLFIKLEKVLRTMHSSLAFQNQWEEFLDYGVFYKMPLESLEKELKLAEKELMICKSFGLKPTGRIDASMVEEARSVEIESILDQPVRRWMTRCVNHEDKNPSMYIKNNRAYCFSCGWKGDSIAVYQKINNNCDFIVAVKNLCRK